MPIIKQLLEKLDELLYDTKERTIYLYEMSTPLGKVKDKVHDLSEQIIKHSLKILLYGKEEHQTLHHWCHELGNRIGQCVIKIKKHGKDRYPNANELVEWLTDYYSDETDIEFMRYNLEKDYIYQGHTERETITNKQLYDAYVSILKEVCPLIVQKQASDDKIQEIVEKYILG